MNLNINSNGKYAENYVQSLNNLRENFEVQNKIYNSLNNGFKYYDVPRLHNNNENIRLNELHNRIEKSIKYNNSELSNLNIEDLINKENDRLNVYLKNLNFINFSTNIEKNNLKENYKSNTLINENEIKAKHPNLIDLQNMGKMRYNKLKIHGNKFMGKRYDSN